MSQLRSRPKSAQFAFFGLGLCGFALTPTQIGYQDFASRLAQQPGVAERWHRRVFSAVDTLHVAAYSFNVPMGIAAPQAATYQRASFNQGRRHHRFDPAQSGDPDTSALPGVRLSQGRSHAERRPPYRRAAPGGRRARRRGAYLAAEFSRRRRQECGSEAAGCSHAAGSGTCGGIERAAASAIRRLDVA